MHSLHHIWGVGNGALPHGVTAMPRRRGIRRHPSLPPVPQAEPTTKPASVTAVIRRLVILDQIAPAKAIEAKLAEAGFPGTNSRRLRRSGRMRWRHCARRWLWVCCGLQILCSKNPEPEFLASSQPIAGLAARGVGRGRLRKPPPDSEGSTRRHPHLRLGQGPHGDTGLRPSR
jgi:hypothetical protein